MWGRDQFVDTTSGGDDAVVARHREHVTDTVVAAGAA
jgi:hypothetical protein